MPYIVNKEFRALGRLLKQGEIIDADIWKTKNSLLSLGWISYTPDGVKTDVSKTDAAKTADNQDVETAGAETPLKAAKASQKSDKSNR